MLLAGERNINEKKKCRVASEKRTTGATSTGSFFTRKPLVALSAGTWFGTVFEGIGARGIAGLLGGIGASSSESKPGKLADLTTRLGIGEVEEGGLF